jgi:hypothetical protein
MSHHSWLGPELVLWSVMGRETWNLSLTGAPGRPSHRLRDVRLGLKPFVSVEKLPVAVASCQLHFVHPGQT